SRGLCEVETLVQQTGLVSVLAIDESVVYWVGSKGLMRVPKDGGDPALLSPFIAAVRGIAADNTTVYLSDSLEGAVLAIPKRGGVPTTLAAKQPETGGIALGPSDVYFSTENSIRRVPKSGGAPTTVVTVNAKPTEVAVDASSVYWTEHESGN